MIIPFTVQHLESIEFLFTVMRDLPQDLREEVDAIALRAKANEITQEDSERLDALHEQFA